MSLLERITVDPEIVHGRPAVRGTRMRVSDVLSLLAAGADQTHLIIEKHKLRGQDGRNATVSIARIPQ